MPIPAPDAPDVAATLLRLFRQMHDQVRSEIHDLDAAGLNWAPTAGANSIATIVTHVLGSEAETLRCVAGLDCQRDRDAEFVPNPRDPLEVLAALGDADLLVAELAPRIDEHRVQSVFPLPTLRPDDVRSGLAWLVGNYGHAREHVGQIQLTKQVYLADAATAWAEALDEAQDPRA